MDADLGGRILCRWYNHCLGCDWHAFSAIAIQTISAGLWFFTYRFIFWPMLVVYPSLILLTMIIPVLLYRGIARDSIIERLRQG